MPVQGVGNGPYKGPLPEETSGPKGVSGNFEQKSSSLEEARRTFIALQNEHPPTLETLFAMQNILQQVINDPNVPEKIKNDLSKDLQLLQNSIGIGGDQIDGEKLFEAFNALQNHLRVLK